MRSWLDDAGPWAWVAVVLGQAVALVTPVPRSALSVLVGAVVGFTAGLVLVVIGGVLGGLGGFVLSRCLGRDAMIRVAGDRLRRLDDALGERSVVAIVVARLMPILPFMLVSYAAGLSAMRIAPYTLGTAVGLLPGSVMYTAIGASMAASPPWTTAAPVTVAITVGLVLAVLGRRFLMRCTRTPMGDCSARWTQARQSDGDQPSDSRFRWQATGSR